MTSMDKGTFAKGTITIEPCANGSYLVTVRPELYSGSPLVSHSAAFSNWRDLLAFLNEDYEVANAPMASPAGNSIKSDRSEP